jgi:hypothetical protein
LTCFHARSGSGSRNLSISKSAGDWTSFLHPRLPLHLHGIGPICLVCLISSFRVVLTGICLDFRPGILPIVPSPYASGSKAIRGSRCGHICIYVAACHITSPRTPFSAPRRPCTVLQGILMPKRHVRAGRCRSSLSMTSINTSTCGIGTLSPCYAENGYTRGLLGTELLMKLD